MTNERAVTRGKLREGDVECFMITPTERIRVQLRRYRRLGEKGFECPSRHDGLGCEATTLLGVAPLSAETVSRNCEPVEAGTQPKVERLPDGIEVDDAAGWPGTCDHCGSEFAATHPARLEILSEWEPRNDDVSVTPQRFTLHGAPAGAMWSASWMANTEEGHPPIVIRLPDGSDWKPSGPSMHGDGWEIEGEPPDLTVRPSIGIPDEDGGYRYHAYLINGVLRRI